MPYLADSISDKQIFMSQRVFKHTLALAEQASFYLVTLGNATNTACCFGTGCSRDAACRNSSERAPFATAWASFSDPDGQVVSSELNQRTLAVDLAHLYDREVILLCAGRQKLRAVQGLLKAGFVKGLIIDGDTALCLNEEGDQ